MARYISDIHMFVAVVEAGSLSAAARMLGTAPSVMSRRLLALEGRLGVRLVTRTTRQFELTPEGALFNERCLRIVAEIEAAEAEVTLGVMSPRGLLRVAAPIHWGRRVLAPMLAEFSTAYPSLQVQLALSDAGLDVLHDSLDVSIWTAPPRGTDIIVRKLLGGHRIVCAAPGYIARHGCPRTPEDLLHHDCIRLIQGQGVVDTWLFSRESSAWRIQVSGTLATTSTEVIYDWVKAGRGIGLRAEWDVAADLRTGRLIDCLPTYTSEEFNLYASFVSRQHLASRIRVFLDALQEWVSRTAARA